MVLYPFLNIKYYSMNDSNHCLVVNRLSTRLHPKSLFLSLPPLSLFLQLVFANNTHASAKTSMQYFTHVKWFHVTYAVSSVKTTYKAIEYHINYIFLLWPPWCIQYVHASIVFLFNIWQFLLPEYQHIWHLVWTFTKSQYLCISEMKTLLKYRGVHIYLDSIKPIVSVSVIFIFNPSPRLPSHSNSLFAFELQQHINYFRQTISSLNIKNLNWMSFSRTVQTQNLVYTCICITHLHIVK